MRLDLDAYCFLLFLSLFIPVKITLTIGSKLKTSSAGAIVKCVIWMVVKLPDKLTMTAYHLCQIFKFGLFDLILDIHD